MAEELAKTATGAAPEGGAPATGTPTPAAAGAAPAAVSKDTGGAPDIEALVAERVRAEAEKIRRQYEGPDGHIAKLKSKADRAEAALRQRQQQEYQQAQALMQQNPEHAAAILARQVDELRQKEVATEGTAMMSRWVSDVAQSHELKADDPELAKLAEEMGVLYAPQMPPDQANAVTFQFEHALGQLQVKRERERAEKAEKDLKSTLANLPDLVKKEVTRTLAGKGFGEIDDTSPGAPVGSEVDLTKLSPHQLLDLGIKLKRQGK